MISLDVLDSASIQSGAVPVYPIKQGFLRQVVYLNPTGESQVLPVYTGLMWFGEFTIEYRLQVLGGVYCSTQTIRC